MRCTALLVLAALTILAAGCADEPPVIAVRVYPAVLAADADTASATWDSVRFAGSPRAAAGLYLVRPEPLLTEWNIVDFRPAQQPDGSQAVAARLNAFGAQQISRFTAQPASHKRPLAVQVNGRWADFSPVLQQLSQQLTLYGFRPEEVSTLRAHIDTR